MIEHWKSDKLDNAIETMKFEKSDYPRKINEWTTHLLLLFFVVWFKKSKQMHFPNLVAIFQDLLFLLFLDIGLLLTGKLLNQGFLVFKKSSLQKFYSHHYDLVYHYRISVITTMLTTMWSLPHSWLFTIFSSRIKTSATYGAGTAYPSGALEFILGF